MKHLLNHKFICNLYLKVKISINYISIIIYSENSGILLYNIFKKQQYNLFYFIMFIFLWLFELGLIKLKCSLKNK